MIIFDNVTQRYPTPKGVHTILKNLSFSLEAGCKIGILGLNGAGKSTLLNLISGAQLPDSGKIHRMGRVSWPLGFAGGFNGSLSGLENCLFAARIYGHDPRDVVDYVAEFSELGRHFQLPVRSYSSGMKARLAFGLSLAFNFDFYLVDEVIGVGDVRFRKKCRNALQKLHAEAGIIMVSHSPAIIREYCTRIAVVHDKTVSFFPKLEEGFAFYDGIAKQDPAPTAGDLIEGTNDAAIYA